MAQKIVKLGLKREKNHLYYIGKDGNVWAAPMARAGKKGGKAKKVADAGVKKEKGFLYFLDKNGDVAWAKMPKGNEEYNEEDDDDEDDVKMVFVNIGWMKKYQGVGKKDTIIGGGKYVKRNEFGFEIYNFLPYKGYFYADGCRPYKLDRIGAESREDESLNNVLIIWTARNPDGWGTKIVGWYEDATVYKNIHPLPKGCKRKPIKNFWAKTKKQNGYLIPEDLREFDIPHRGKGWMGRDNVWYADKLKNSFWGKKSNHRKFREKVLAYIKEIKTDILNP